MAQCFPQVQLATYLEQNWSYFMTVIMVPAAVIADIGIAACCSLALGVSLGLCSDNVVSYGV